MTTSAPNEVTVGIGDALIADPPQVLVAHALGTCVGIVLWDPANLRGGMLHAQLPEFQEGLRRPRGAFVDTGLEDLLFLMDPTMRRWRNMRCQLVGGASIRANLDRYKIGARNVEAAKKAASKFGLIVAGEAVGGDTARTVRLYVDSGQTKVFTPGAKTIQL